MAVLSAPDLTKLRTKKQAAKVYLSVFKPTTLLTALINEPSATPGMRQIDYDGGTGSGFSLIEAGQPLIFNGRKVRIKSITGNQTSGTITLAENSEVWADNATITILHDYPLFPIVPSFDAETEVFYKDIGSGASGVAYTDENEEPPPVCIVGTHAFVGWWRGITETLTRSVSQTSDDGRELADGTVSISSMLQVTAANDWLAFRLLDMDVPYAATLASAYLTVDVLSTSLDDPNFEVYGEDADNAATIVEAANNISSRSRTTAFTNWIDTGIGAGEKVSPNLASPVQEVINRPGWAAGNALMVLLKGLSGVNFNVIGYSAYATSLALTFTESVVFDFDLSDSYPVAQGATIVSYSATALPATNIEIVLNTSTGVGQIICRAASQWIVKFGCTDSNGKTQYTYRKVMTTTPYRDFTTSSPSGAWDAGGWAYDAAVHGDATLSDFPDEALCVLWYDNRIDGAEDYINIWASGDAYRGRNILCAGYIQNDQSSDDYDAGTGVVSFRVETPESLLATRTEFGTLELEAVASPADWYQYSTWLTVGRAIHHHLKWHSTALEVLDIWGLGDNTLKMRFASFSENSLLQRDNNLAFNNGINARLVCDRLGRLHLVRDSQILGNSERSALDTVFELTSRDVSGQFTTPRNPVRQVIQTVVNGFAFDGTNSTPLLSIAPGNVTENSGTGRISRPGQVLEDQDELNERTGRIHAVANSVLGDEPLTFESNYVGALDIIPSLGFYEWGLADNSLKRQLALNGQRLICRTVTLNLLYSDSGFTGTIQTAATFEWEAEGESGQTDDYPGFPACPPGVGSSQRIENDPTPSDEAMDESAFPPVVLLAFSSVNYRRLDGLVDWAELLVDDVFYGCLDRWWHLKASSFDPENLITWISGDGFITELAGNSAPAETDRTPSTNPPDSWSDTPDPTAATSDFIQIESDAYTQDVFYALVQFQNGSSQYRGWLAKRTTGSTYSYLPLYTGSLPTQSRPIYMAITCSHILVTCWQDLATDKLKLLVFTKSPFAFSQEVDLGNTTLTELNNRTYFAVPAASPDYSATTPDAAAPWFVLGRMNSPAGLSGTKWAIKYTGAWSEISLLDIDGVSETWGTDYGLALKVGSKTADGHPLYACRHSSDLFLSFSSPGSSLKIEDDNSSVPRPSLLSSDRVGVIYPNNADNALQGRVVDTSGTTLSSGASDDITSSTPSDYDLRRLEDDKFILLMSNTSTVDLRVVSANGDSFTAGTNYEVYSGTIANQILIVPSGATAGFFLYRYVVSGDTQAWMNKFFVGGTTVSVGTAVEHSESSSGLAPVPFAGDALTGNSIMMMYASGNDDDLKLQIIEFSVGVNEGTAAVLSAGSSATQFINTGQQSLAKLETGKVVACWLDGSTAKAAIVTYSGTSISAVGTPVTLASGGSTGAPSVVALSATRFLAVYVNSSGTIKAETFSVSGATISSDANSITAGDNTPSGAVMITLLGTTGALLCWESGSDIYVDRILNLSGSSFYYGLDTLQKRSTLPFQELNPGALSIAAPYALIGSAEAGQTMVAYASDVDNYATWTDFTGSLEQSPIDAFDATPWGSGASAGETGDDFDPISGFLQNGKC